MCLVFLDCTDFEFFDDARGDPAVALHVWLSEITTSTCHDARRTCRVDFEIRSDVVDLVVEDDPAVFLSVVFCNLFTCELAEVWEWLHFVCPGHLDMCAL